jgi:hypothetical protein
MYHLKPIPATVAVLLGTHAIAWSVVLAEVMAHSKSVARAWSACRPAHAQSVSTHVVVKQVLLPGVQVSADWQGQVAMAKNNFWQQHAKRKKARRFKLSSMHGLDDVECWTLCSNCTVQRVRWRAPRSR